VKGATKNNMINAVIAIVLAYLIGSINFAVIFSKLFTKKDVRDMGSGNAGATNVLRTAGLLPGILTFLFDALKGFTACFVGKVIFLSAAYNGGSFPYGEYAVYLAFACGLACMLGHVFPVFFRFKGGKGVAVAVGIFAVCCPIAIILGLSVFALALIISKIVSLSSLLATVTVVVFSAVFYDKSASLLPQIILSVSMGAVVFLKHIDNIKRLISGTEKKIHIGRKQ